MNKHTRRTRAVFTGPALAVLAFALVIAGFSGNVPAQPVPVRQDFTKADLEKMIAQQGPPEEAQARRRRFERFVALTPEDVDLLYMAVGSPTGGTSVNGAGQTAYGEGQGPSGAVADVHQRCGPEQGTGRAAGSVGGEGP
jgi:hypothetical protein